MEYTKKMSEWRIGRIANGTVVKKEWLVCIGKEEKEDAKRDRKVFFFQAEADKQDSVASRGLGNMYKRQT